MGTKIQCKRYIPDCYAMKDLNEDVTNNWSSYYEDKTSNGSQYSGFIMQPVKQHSGHDKEMLKQTMLEHEATFRKQVHELHRLYRIQKDLMDDFKNKEFYRYFSSNGASQSHSYLPQIPFEANGPKRQLSQMPTFDAFGDKNYHDNFPSDNGISPQVSRSVESKTKTPSKRMFDLQLPADVYVDAEDLETAKKEDAAESLSGVTISLKSEKNAVLMFGPGEDDCSRNVYSKSQNGRFSQIIADLNEPVKDEASYRGADVPSSSLSLIGTKTHFDEVGDRLPKKSATAGWYTDFFQEIHKGKASCSGTLTEQEREKQQWQFFNSDAGSSRKGAMIFDRGFSKETFPMSYEAVLSKPRKTQEDLPYNNNGKTWIGEPSNYGIGFSRQRSHFANLSSINVDFSSATASTLREAVDGINHVQVPMHSQSRNLNMATGNSVRTGDSYEDGSEKGLIPSFSTKSTYMNGVYHPTCILDKPNYDYTKYLKSLHTPDIKPSKNAYEYIYDAEGGASGSISWLRTRMARNKSIILERNNSEIVDLNDTVNSVAGSSEENNPIFRNRINLNLNVPGESLEFLPDVEADHQKQPITKRPFIIDLEVPAEPTEEDVFHPQETEISMEALLKGAAENIIALSKDTSFPSSNSCTVHSSSPDSLHWFVDAVLHNEKRTENLLTCSDDEMSDSFERLTLKLEEIKPENYLILRKDEDNWKDEGKSAASLLTRSRRGQARRRRQRRDFQKDILPGLVTLSRHEITEDLQAFGGLVKITGRRNSGRKSRAAVTNIVDPNDSPKVEHNIQFDNKTVEGGIISWGKTRRCRRQRLPPGSVATPLT